MDPKFLFKTAGSNQQCHDSNVFESTDDRTVLAVSDGGGRRQRMYDISNIDSSWSSGLPPLIGETDQISGIYAHSNWATEDGRYLFSWDENNNIDISVHDITDITDPIQIALFQYSDNARNNALPHNGQVRGQYLYVAYYEAGLRVFDISNPYYPYEVGTVETFQRSIRGNMEGAWNVSVLSAMDCYSRRSKWQSLTLPSCS